MLKKLAICFLMLVFLAGAGTLVAYRVFVSGVAGVDDWVVRKIVDIAELYLVPDIKFASFQYDGKGLVTLNDVKLIAPDGTEVVSAQALRVTLAGIPSREKGIVIERVELDHADLRLIRKTGKHAGFKGLVPFVKRKQIREQDQVPQDMRLSRAFEIRKISLTEGAVVYDAGNDQPPIHVKHINLGMDISPAQNAGNTDRAYVLDLDVDRAPLLTLASKGTLDIDALTLDLQSLRFSLDLSHERAVASLPGPLQTLIHDHEIRGLLDIDASGRLQARTPRDSTLSAKIQLDQSSFAASEYRFPVDKGLINVEMSDRLVRFPTVQLDTCGGQVTASDAQIDVSDAPHASLSWSIAGFELRELLRNQTDSDETDGNDKADEGPKFAGVLASSGHIAMTLDQVPQSITGSGESTVKDGRLGNLPIESALAGALNIFGVLPGSKATSDTSEVKFDLDGEGMRISHGKVQTETLTAEGDGTIFYDGHLDLILNAGPLEKIKSAAGVVGDVFGLITDNMVKYKVTGTIDDVKVEVLPLGIGG